MGEMNKKKLVPGHNCDFHLAKGGIFTIYAMPDFTVMDCIRTYNLAKLHAKYKKIKRPVKWLLVPTVTEVA